LIGGAGVLFTVGLLLVAGGSIAASNIEDRRQRTKNGHADHSDSRVR
jgi:hypothetical protein